MRTPQIPALPNMTPLGLRATPAEQAAAAAAIEKLQAASAAALANARAQHAAFYPEDRPTGFRPMSPADAEVAADLRSHWARDMDEERRAIEAEERELGAWNN